MSNLVFIYTTFPDVEEAKMISMELLEAKLVICVNIFPEVNFLYLWEGKVNDSYEVVTIMKGKNDQVDKVIKKIEGRHSYSQPVITVIPIEKINFLGNSIGV